MLLALWARAPLGSKPMAAAELAADAGLILEPGAVLVVWFVLESAWAGLGAGAEIARA